MKRNFLRAWPAFVVTFFVFLLALFLVSGNKSSVSQPLSPIEARLVGKWYDKEPDDTRNFLPDRTFSTSSGQFVGTWRINDGRLTVTYWQPYERPSDYTISAVIHSFTRTRETTISWEIEFADDSQTHTISHGIAHQYPDDEVLPDEKWEWTRASNK